MAPNEEILKALTFIDINAFCLWTDKEARYIDKLPYSFQAVIADCVKRRDLPDSSAREMMEAWAFKKWQSTLKLKEELPVLVVEDAPKVVKDVPKCTWHNCPKLGTPTKCLLCWSLRDRIVRHKQQYDKVVKKPHSRFVHVYAPHIIAKNPMLKTCSTEDLWKLTVTEAFKRFQI